MPVLRRMPRERFQGAHLYHPPAPAAGGGGADRGRHHVRAPDPGDLRADRQPAPGRRLHPARDRADRPRPPAETFSNPLSRLLPRLRDRGNRPPVLGRRRALRAHPRPVLPPCPHLARPGGLPPRIPRGPGPGLPPRARGAARCRPQRGRRAGRVHRHLQQFREDDDHGARKALPRPRGRPAGAQHTDRRPRALHKMHQPPGVRGQDIDQGRPPRARPQLVVRRAGDCERRRGVSDVCKDGAGFDDAG